MAKYFPKRMYWVFVIRGSILNLVFSAILAIITKSLICTLIFFMVYQIFLMIFYRIRLEHYAERVFNERNNKGIIDKSFEIEF